MSSSVYRALRAAGYEDSGIIAFATSLLSQLCTSGRPNPTGEEPAVDDRTGLPTGSAFAQILQFEFDRARSMQNAGLGIIVVTPRHPQLLAAAQRFADETLISELVHARLRDCDAAGRSDDGEFVLLLRAAGDRSVASTAGDLQRVLEAAPLAAGHAPDVRWLTLKPEMQDAHALLQAVRRRRSIPARHRSNPRTAEPLRSPVALALCGGAAMAAAHIGVLDALQQLQIGVAGIGASSAGALVAAMYASALTRDDMLHRFTSFSRSEVYAKIRQAYAHHLAQARREGRAQPVRFGFASRDRLAVVDDPVLRALVEHFVPTDRPIESLPIRLAFCATDLVAGTTTYISHGSLHDALMAACAVPGLFPPQRRGSKLLVDGSLAGELPIAAASSIASGSAIVACHLDKQNPTPASLSSGLDVATRVAKIRQAELVREQTRHCAAVLQIPVKDVGWMGFSRCAQAEQAGRQTALAELHKTLRPLTPTGVEAVCDLDRFRKAGNGS